MIWGNAEVHKPPWRSRRPVATLATLVCALLAFAALPALAAAEIFQVNSLNDGSKTVGGAICEATFPGECTLRAAIEAANVDSSADEITFSTAIFDGVAGADEIEPATALPAITKPATVNGRSLSAGAYLKPSVGVKAPVGAVGLTVESPDVAIKHVAFGGGGTGIEVVAGSTGFLAVGDWFGLRLDAGAAAITGAGILVGAGADEATIGADEFELANRNVFANAEVGVQIEGASKTKIRGNYIGVGPAGTAATDLTDGVRIADTLTSQAVENEVGGILTGPQVGTAACDGACNVIATKNGDGIVLSDPAAGIAASGPTTIRGNYLGLDPTGVGTVGESAYAVLAAPATIGCDEGPGEVTVGGLAPTERNYIAGGAFGIEAESAAEFRALGNWIGIAPDGSAVEAPDLLAIGVCAETLTSPALVAGNQMVLGPETFGIETFFGQSVLVGNSIQGGLIGIQTAGSGPGGGDVIQANSITGTDGQGIVLQDELNVVTGNVVSGSAGSGIEVESGAEHNRIGGDQPGEANTINGAGVDSESGAILIVGTNASRNEVAANTGSGNFGDFIELVGQGSSETPNGLQPPVVATAAQSAATGTAAPNTTVRVFSKASAEEGELGELLAVVKADAAGAWSATYPTQPVGTLVAATQTSDAGAAVAGTSEVGAPLAASADPPKPPEPEGGGGVGGGATGGGNPPPGTQPVPVGPQTKITKSPKKASTATIATFRFKAKPAPAAKFECRLDRTKWAKCTSPKTYKNLKPGKHTFRVRAIAGGVKGAVTKFPFTVKS